MFGGGRGRMSSGGGGMLRAAGRTMTRAGVPNGGIQDPFSSSLSSSASSGASNASSHGGNTGSASRQPQKLSSTSGSSNLTISASGSPLNFPVAANSGLSGGDAFAYLSSDDYDEFDWVSEQGSDVEFLFGCVPSVDEVQDALSALRQAYDGSANSGLVRDRFRSNVNNIGPIQSPADAIHRASSPFAADQDWIEPSTQLYNPRTLQTHGSDGVYDAFHLLQTQPSVQRMVVSLSSDRAFWDAVMNNDVVREIRELYRAGTSQGRGVKSSDKTAKGNSAAADFIKWVIDNTKAMFEKISKIVTDFFKDLRSEPNALLEDALSTSVVLSIVVLLVVIMARV